MHEIRKLSATNIDELLPVFHDAFADYAVDMNLGAAAFKDMLQIRGYQPAHSMGCFVAGQLKGFILVATRRSGQQLLAYNLTTAVARSYQGQGCADELLVAVIAHLKALGTDHFILEVLQDNLRAINLYQKHLFSTARQLSCFKLQKRALDAHPQRAVSNLQSDVVISLLSDQRFHCFVPSWQNALASYLNMPHAFAVVPLHQVGLVTAWGVVHKHNGQILQLGLLPEYRTADTIKHLITDLAAYTTATQLSCLNIESSCGLPELLVQIGFELTVEQHEMTRSLA